MTIACPDCGLLETIPSLGRRSTALCRLCHSELEKTSGRSITAALSCSVAVFLLLVPGNLLPLVRIDLFGYRMQNLVSVGIADLWKQGWIILAGLSAAFIIVLPFIRFGLLSMVLGALKLHKRYSWLGSAFRWALWLDRWAMSDVFLLAGFVGYYRLINIGQANVSLQAGGFCFIAAAIFTMLSRASLDKRSVWRLIGPEKHLSENPILLSCTTCNLPQPLSADGRPCPRCGARLSTRKSAAMTRTAALLGAAFLLILPANIYPMNISNQLGSHQSYTIFTGVKALFESGLWPLGIVIFCTSILIPVAKMAVIAWCLASARWGLGRRLITKTRLFRLVSELGRWSNTDPFTIVFFVPLVHFGALASASAGWGATAFVMMTTLTMAAATTFDPRLMWDQAERRAA